MSQNIIEVKNISKTFKLPTERVDSLRDRILGVFNHNSFKEFKALEDISFEVKRGEFLGIIGKNGSGKSTLLKILAGVYEPDKGKVIVRGKISPFLELGVGFNGELSARDNIYLNGTILGLSEKQIDEKFDRIIEFAELQDFVETKVKNFSSGMYARLAFSVAIEAEADIYLMDEVLAVGDANFQAKCFDKFRELREQGKTIILVSHSKDQILKYSTKVILLDSGKLRMSKSAEESYEYYEQQIINHTLSGNTTRKDKYTKSSIRKIVSSINKSHVNESDTNLIVTIQVFPAKTIKNLITGIIIRNKYGTEILNYNSADSTNTIDLIEEESKTLNFNIQNVFSDGTYDVDFAIADKPTNEIYYWRNSILSFEVINKHNSHGIVNIPCKLHIN